MVKAIWRAWRKRCDRRDRALIEDALKHISGRRREGARPDAASLAGALDLSRQAAERLIVRIQAVGLLRRSPDRLELTEEGERWALQVVRAHRLWETYLANEARLPTAEIHDYAEREEHRLIAREAVDELDAFLGHPRSDPHGEPIPTASGKMGTPPPAAAIPESEALTSLCELKPGEEAEVVRLDPGLRGFTRRRLLDLGLTAKARVTAHLANAFGDPLAYRVRGTTIALRKEQASQVRVRRLAATEAS